MTKKLAKVFHAELFGKRNDKFQNLNADFAEIEWKELDVQDPYYFFVPKDFAAMEEYEKGFGVDELFENHSSGVQTQKDKVAIQKTKHEMNTVISDFKNLAETDFRLKYDIGKDSNDWSYENAKKDVLSEKSTVTKISYRPFDLRFAKYSGVKGLMARHRDGTMQHFIGKENLGLAVSKQQSTFDFQHVFIIQTISERCLISSQTKEGNSVFPLYLYHTDGTRTANLDPKMVKRFADELGMDFVDEYEKQDSRLRGNDDVLTPENVLDYIYAVLHSPSYREKYKEFLKINFPRIPYPKDLAGENPNVNEIFEKLVGLGKQIREIHLLESSETENYVTTFPVAGDNLLAKKYPKFVVSKKNEHMGNVYINETQYFGNVPKSAWEFYIGGYQPAQKWLKDRKETALSFEDLLHWQKIIVALKQTKDIMEKIDILL